MSNTAVQYKETGNNYFKQLKFDDAIEAYSQAILKNNSEPAYFTNRALCYMSVKKWAAAADDCRRALELDMRHVKVRSFLLAYFSKTRLRAHSHRQIIFSAKFYIIAGSSMRQFQC